MDLKISGLVLVLSIGQLLAFIDKPVAQYLQDTSKYSTLASLLKKAGLYDTLNSGGPYTVFAPTNAAFAKLPADELQALQNNPSALSYILQAHVIGGYILAPQLKDGSSQNAINGQSLQFTISGGSIMVNNARVSNSDTIVNNGVVHEVDSVLVDVVTESIAEILLEKQAQFSTLDLLLTIADLHSVLLSGQFTLFAPTNAAFTNIAAALPDIRTQSDKDKYAEILKNHVISGVYNARDLSDNQVLTTLHGQKVTVHLNPSAKINSANIIETDIKATNGVIHVIDAVLVPTDVAL